MEHNKKCWSLQGSIFRQWGHRHFTTALLPLFDLPACVFLCLNMLGVFSAKLSITKHLQLYLHTSFFTITPCSMHAYIKMWQFADHWMTYLYSLVFTSEWTLIWDQPKSPVIQKYWMLNDTPTDPSFREFCFSQSKSQKGKSTAGRRMTWSSVSSLPHALADEFWQRMKLEPPQSWPWVHFSVTKPIQGEASSSSRTLKTMFNHTTIKIQSLQTAVTYAEDTEGETFAERNIQSPKEAFVVKWTIHVGRKGNVDAVFPVWDAMAYFIVNSINVCQISFKKTGAILSNTSLPSFTTEKIHSNYSAIRHCSTLKHEYIFSVTL